METIFQRRNGGKLLTIYFYKLVDRQRVENCKMKEARKEEEERSKRKNKVGFFHFFVERVSNTNE